MHWFLDDSFETSIGKDLEHALQALDINFRLKLAVTALEIEQTVLLQHILETFRTESNFEEIFGWYWSGAAQLAQTDTLSALADMAQEQSISISRLSRAEAVINYSYDNPNIEMLSVLFDSNQALTLWNAVGKGDLEALQTFLRNEQETLSEEAKGFALIHAAQLDAVETAQCLLAESSFAGLPEFYKGAAMEVYPHNPNMLALLLQDENAEVVSADIKEYCLKTYVLQDNIEGARVFLEDTARDPISVESKEKMLDLAVKSTHSTEMAELLLQSTVRESISEEYKLSLLNEVNYLGDKEMGAFLTTHLAEIAEETDSMQVFLDSDTGAVEIDFGSELEDEQVVTLGPTAETSAQWITPPTTVAYEPMEVSQTV